MRQVKTFVLLLLGIIGLAAAYQNITPIRGKNIQLGLDLYVASWQTDPIPLGFVIVLCLLGGAGIMALVDLPVLFRLRKRVRRLEKDLAASRPAGTQDDDEEIREAGDARPDVAQAG